MGEGFHGIDRTDEAVEPVLLRPVDESDVVVRIDVQARQDRRQVIGDLAAFAFNDCAAGPVDQFQVVPDFIADCMLRSVRALVGEGH